MSSNTFLRLPVTLMSSVMGVAGLATAAKASGINALAPTVSAVAVGAIVMLLIFTLSLFARYRKKTTQYFDEMANMVSRNFLSCGTISLFLLSGLFNSPALWMLGAVIQVPLFIFVLARWVYGCENLLATFNPTFLIPPLANVVCSIFVPEWFKGFGYFMFLLGMLVGGGVYLALLSRLVKKAFIAKPLYPTYFIMMATPSMFFLGQQTYAIRLSAVSVGYYIWAVIASIAILLNIRKFIGTNFSLAFWAFTFPMAAFTTATYQYIYLTGAPLWIGHCLLAITFLILLNVITRTVLNRKDLLLPQ
ncbi:SLAC1 family transporter [Photobacterium sp. DNB22_13_2]